MQACRPAGISLNSPLGIEENEWITMLPSTEYTTIWKKTGLIKP
jgi:hypothetical protein